MDGTTPAPMPSNTYFIDECKVAMHGGFRVEECRLLKAITSRVSTRATLSKQPPYTLQSALIRKGGAGERRTNLSGDPLSDFVWWPGRCHIPE
jgi:hypothetical protein